MCRAVPLSVQVSLREVTSPSLLPPSLFLFENRLNATWIRAAAHVQLMDHISLSLEECQSEVRDSLLRESEEVKKEYQRWKVCHVSCTP